MRNKSGECTQKKETKPSINLLQSKPWHSTKSITHERFFFPFQYTNDDKPYRSLRTFRDRFLWRWWFLAHLPGSCSNADRTPERQTNRDMGKKYRSQQNQYKLNQSINQSTESIANQVNPSNQSINRSMSWLQDYTPPLLRIALQWVHGHFAFSRKSSHRCRASPSPAALPRQSRPVRSRIEWSKHTCQCVHTTYLMIARWLQCGASHLGELQRQGVEQIKSTRNSEFYRILKTSL